MKGYHRPSGLRQGLELLIDPTWSAEQALAVVELLDDLRDRIWAHYAPVLLEHYREDPVTQHNVDITDPPF